VRRARGRIQHRPCMRPSLIPLALVLCCVAIVRAEPPSPAIDLLADTQLAGWTVVSSDGTPVAGLCTRTAEGVVVAGSSSSYLLTEGVYENYTLSIEYRWPANAVTRTNGGVLLHVAARPTTAQPWPTCFQLQTKSQYVGELRQIGGATFAEPITTPARNNMPPIRTRQATSSELPPGEWNTVKVVCRNGSIEVRVNGVLQNSVTAAQPHTGRIGIALEGSALEFRSMRLTPLPAG
jgi:hypothetical protein